MKTLTGLLAGATALFGCCGQPAFALDPGEFSVGAQVAQGISEFGVGRNNRGKLGGLVVDWTPRVLEKEPFLRHLRLRGFLGLATTKNLASGEMFPILTLQPGIEITRGPAFAGLYPFGIAYAPNPASGSMYQFVFETNMGVHAAESVDVYVFWKHLSNGDTMSPNPGLDCWGVGVSFSLERELKAREEGDRAR